MVMLITTVVFFGGLIMYLSSKKDMQEFNQGALYLIAKYKKVSRLTGLTFLLIAAVLATGHFGLTSGLCVWLFMVTLLLSLIILLYPVKTIGYKELVIVFIVLIVLELLL